MTRPTTPAPATPPRPRPVDPPVILPRHPRCPDRCALFLAGDECGRAADLAEVQAVFRRRRFLAPIVLDLRTGRRAA
jgi:hypothetical protein